MQATVPLGFDDVTRIEIENSICREGGPLPECFTYPMEHVLCLLEEVLHSITFQNLLSISLSSSERNEKCSVVLWIGPQLSISPYGRRPLLQVGSEVFLYNKGHNSQNNLTFYRNHEIIANILSSHWKTLTGHDNIFVYFYKFLEIMKICTHFSPSIRFSLHCKLPDTLNIGGKLDFWIEDAGSTPQNFELFLGR